MYNRKIPHLPRQSILEDKKFVLPIAAVVGIVAGAGALAQATSNFVSQKSANKSNKKLTRETNDLNYRMFKEQMEYEKAQADLEFERNKEQQAYATQVGLMRQAGLNPAVMYGQGSVSQPAQYERASSVSRPEMVAPQVQPEQFDFATPVQQAIGAASQFENEIMQSPLNRDIKESSARANNASAQETQVRARMEQFQLDIDKLFSGMERTVELNKAINEFKNSVADWQNKILQGKNIQADTVNKYADTFLKHMQTQLTEEQYEALKQQMPQILANLVATGENIKAETYATKKNADTNALVGRAQAGYYAEQANDLRKTRQARIDNMKADSRQKNALSAINEFEFDTSPNKISASYHKFVNMCLDTMAHRASTQYLSKELELIGQEIERAKKNNDWYLVNQLMDNAKDIAIALGSVAIGAKTGKDLMGSKPRPIGFNK